MKRHLLGCLAAVVVAAAGPALAEDCKKSGAPEPAGLAAGGDNWTFTFQVENEFFLPGKNDDRYYTQGIQLNLLTPSNRTPLKKLACAMPTLWNLEKGFLKDDAHLRGGFVLGQNIYTPEDLTLLEPDPRDRPYAGWLYVGAEVIAYSDVRLDALQLQVGAVGPVALGGWAQNGWHRHVNHIDEAQGWKRQLHNEPAFVLYGERRLRTPLGGEAPPEAVGLDVTRNVNFALGTVQTSVGAGAMLRLGTHLGDDFGPARIRPAPVGSSVFRATSGFAWYGYVGADVKVIGRDIFLDGNTFRDSRRVDKRWVVGEIQAGAVVRYKFLRATYAQVWRSQEFLGQNGTTHFGALTFGVYKPLGVGGSRKD